MAKPPRRPRSQLRKSDAAVEQAVGRALVPKAADPRQSRLFDSPLPKWIKPCLPTLVDTPPSGSAWFHEIKRDGYRISVYVEDGEVVIRTRNGHDWTSRFPTIAKAAAGLQVRSAVIDGEAVVLDDRGRSSFAELQADFDKGSSARAVIYAFDLLFLDGEDLRDRPLEDRRLALGRVIQKRSTIMMSEEFEGVGADLFRVACENDLEGIVSKRRDKPYRSGRRREWLKTKCVQSEAFVIIGYQPGSGVARVPIANLKVARFDGRGLRYVGAVGTGFGDAAGKMLREKLDAARVARCVVPGLKVSGAVWVAPDLRAEIAFRGLTGSGELRGASFKGLRGPGD